MKAKTAIVFILASFVLLSFLVSLSSCKDDSCSEYHIRELNQDTALIFYDGYETLKFVIEDSLGNFLDSATFKGVGKRKYILGDDRKMQTCGDILHDHQNMDYIYANQDDPEEKIIITLRKDETGTVFFIYPPLKLKRAPYQVRTTSFFNPNFTSHHDTITIKGNFYFTVIQLTTEEQVFKSAYFGRYDGILSIEETPNRIWYKVN